MKARAATYEPSGDGGQGYIQVTQGEFGWTSEVKSAQVLLDYDINGNVIGIEVMW